VISGTALHLCVLLQRITLCTFVVFFKFVERSAHPGADRAQQVLKCRPRYRFFNQVDNTINKTLPIKVNVPTADSIGRDLKSKDWRFWALILAGIGFAAALSGALSR
jgi:hypothetical protein